MPYNQLIQAAVETYEQALAWIGADASQADDTIVALYGVKVS
jgi:ubiquitin carboxyl-terminal hydrolase 25/28